MNEWIGSEDTAAAPALTTGQPVLYCAADDDDDGADHIHADKKRPAVSWHSALFSRATLPSIRSMLVGQWVSEHINFNIRPHFLQRVVIY